MQKLQSVSGFVKSQSRITWGSIVATCMDRLKIGFYVAWNSEIFLERLDNAKIAAKESNDLESISFSDHGDLVFNCHQTGRKGGYAYHLSRSDVHIFFSRRKDFDTPNVWVDIGSESCWSPGYLNVLDEIKRLIQDNDGFIVKDTISEAHLCADFIGQDIEELPIDTFKMWITRAEKFNNYQDRSGLLGITMQQEELELPVDGTMVQTGIKIGMGDLMMRIYDKVEELKRVISKQSVFASIWNQHVFDAVPVTRVEFQLRRTVLKQMDVNSLKDLEEKKDAIWKYCTQSWARLTFFEADRKNRHQDRAKLHPWWEAVQQVKIIGTGEEVKREYARAGKDTEPLINMLAGCALSIGTIYNREPTDVEGVIAFGQGALENAIRELWRKRDENNGRREFVKRMKKRRSEIWPMGYEPMPV